MHIKLCDGCIVDYSAAMFLEKNNNDRDMSIKGFLLSHREMFFFPLQPIVLVWVCAHKFVFP